MKQALLAQLPTASALAQPEQQGGLSDAALLHGLRLADVCGGQQAALPLLLACLPHLLTSDGVSGTFPPDVARLRDLQTRLLQHAHAP